MSDQLAIGEMVCRILREFNILPTIEKHPDEELFRVATNFMGRGYVQCVEKSLEDCLANIYNQMKKIQEGMKNG